MKTLGGFIIVTYWLCTFFLMGCRQTEAPSSQEEYRDALLIGLIPEQNIFKQLERHEPLTEYLSRKSGIKLKLIVLTQYGNVIDNFVSAGLDGAFFGSFTYTMAHARLGVEAMARPECRSGSSTYHGVILVRKDSDIENVSQMRGKRFAFVDQETTAGYLFPISYFRENGIEDYQKLLGEFYFTGTHEDAIHDVLNGKADAAAAKNTIFERLAAKNPRFNEELLILARSRAVPQNCLALRSDLSESIKSRLKSTLLSMHEDHEGNEILKKYGAGRFIETRDLDYQAVYDYANELHLDLDTYNFQ
jgi:phosphonate transport system substrate-binding protein